MSTQTPRESDLSFRFKPEMKKAFDGDARFLPITCNKDRAMVIVAEGVATITRNRVI